MSMVCANTSDAITGSCNRTKDLFTLCCTLVAMVLYYDVTIKVLDFFIESWCGRDAGGECSHTVCGCAPVSWVCVCVVAEGSVHVKVVQRLDLLCVSRLRAVYS